VKLTITSALVIISLLASDILMAQDDQYKIATVGFYNVENLFDIEDTPDVRDSEFTPDGSKGWNAEKYEEKLANLCYVINDMGADKVKTGISILGVSEIENASVLEDLVNHPNLKDKEFGIVHYDSPDERGIDVALLYRTKHFKVTNSKPYFVDISKEGKINYTRDILLVSGELDGDPMHFLVNHWPSRSGGEKRSEPGRAKAAQVAKTIVDSLNVLETNPKIIIMGDLNDNPTNKSLVEHLGAKNKLRTVKSQELYNPMADLFRKGYGSNAWRDTWSLFDQVVVSEALLDEKAPGFHYHKAEIHNKRYLTQSIGQYKGYPFRTFVGDAFQGGFSDHFPVYVYLVKKL